ncbi:MAG: hypothetical protein AB4206_05065 [Xenococcaceae cyanobacterium]
MSQFKLLNYQMLKWKKFLAVAMVVEDVAMAVEDVTMTDVTMTITNIKYDD